MILETTTWHLATNIDTHTSESHDALARLCIAYWPPVFAFFRCSGYAPQDAHNATAEFLNYFQSEMLLTSGTARHGSFRECLVQRLTEFAGAEKPHRPDDVSSTIPLNLPASGEADTVAFESLVQSGLSPECAFEKTWATTIARNAIGRMRIEWSRRGHTARVQSLLPYVNVRREDVPVPRIAAEWKADENEVIAALERLRNTMRVYLRREVRETLDDPAHVDRELRRLLVALAGKDR